MRTHLLFSMLTIALALGGAGLAQAGEEADPIVVELFTSQGCSSCPPADNFLSDLAQRSDVLALSFHVDYWDYIGWKDPYASHQATQRQRKYAHSFDIGYVYTPQMVVNGAIQGVGSDRTDIEAAIAHLKTKQGPHPSLRLERQADGGLTLHLSAGDAKSPATIWIVCYDRRHETEVLRGENAGTKLVNRQVVRRFVSVGSWKGEAMEIAIPAAVVEDYAANPEHGVAALLQSDGMGPIIAARVLDSAH